MPQAGVLPTLHDAINFFYEKPWSDGYPIVPPTKALVAQMLTGTRRNADEELGKVPPNLAPLTVKMVAEHAVMAGALPAYIPVIIAGIQATLEPKLNIQGVQTTIHGVSPLLIVNGPYAKKIGLNGGRGCFGPGSRANTTIGRAIRLILYNLGGGYPAASFSCFSQPSRYTFCTAENEDESPWEPLSVTLGFTRGQDVVTVVVCENLQTCADDISEDPQRLHLSTTDCMANQGAQNAYRAADMVVALAPDVADAYAKAGLSKMDVHKLFREKAGRTVRQLKSGGPWSLERLNRWRTKVDPNDDDCFVPTIQEPSRLYLIVAGGRPGASTAVMHGWNETSRGGSLAYEV